MVTKTFPQVILNHITDKIRTRTGLAARLATFTDQKYADLVKKSRDELEEIWDKRYPPNRAIAISSISEAYRQKVGEKPAPIVPYKEKPSAVEVPKPTRLVTEAEKPALIKYYRKEANEWRELADKETRKEPTKEGEQRYAQAILKAEEFERQASELEVTAIPSAVEPKVERVKEVPKDILGILPRVDIGQVKSEEKKELLKLVRRGKVVKYQDYTFPTVKTGYALRRPRLSLEKQAKLESLRSLREGTWKEVPGAQKIARLRIQGKLPVGTMEEVIKAQEARSPRAQATDKARLAKNVLLPTSGAAGIWLEHPEKYDIKGIDTPPLKRRGTPRITPKTPRLRR